MTAAEQKSDIKLTTDTPYLALTGELRGVCCEDLGKNWASFNGTTLYWGECLNLVCQLLYGHNMVVL